MRGHPPWIRFGATGLHVVPSVHHRLVFAQLVYEACRRERFDVIAVELPPSFRARGLLQHVALAGVPRLVIEPTGLTLEMEVPISPHPRCRRTRRRSVEAARVLPLTLCDSIVMALRCPELLQRHWPGWAPELRFVDDELATATRPAESGCELDDYEAQLRGLPAFLASWQPHLRSGRIPEVDERRDRIMAGELRTLLDGGAQVLFVCGAAHWPTIERLLREGQQAAPARRPAAASELLAAPIDPWIAWQRGWLDDFPRVCWALEEACRAHRPGFDKRAALEAVWREGIRQGCERKLPVTPRRLSYATRYLERLTGAAGRWIPELEAHLAHAAAACVDERFAHLVRETALAYPGRGDPRQEADVYRARSGEMLVEVMGRLFLVPAPKRARRRRPAYRRRGAEGLSPEEREEADRGPPSQRDWPDEIRLRGRMEARAAELARELRSRPRSRRACGGLAHGLDGRRTVRALARGERTLYVREPARARQASARPDRDPFVWIFDPAASIVSRFCTYWDEGAPQLVATIFYASNRQLLAGARIEGVELAALVNLNQVPHEVQVAVHGPASRRAAHACLSRVPPERRCRVGPWADPELARFAGTDQAIAAAIRYAARRVVVVSRSSKPLASDVCGYAAERGIELVRVSSDRFASEGLERFRWHHFVPVGKDAYHPPAPWCAHFVPPV